MEYGELGTIKNCTKYVKNTKSFKNLKLQQELCDWDNYLRHTNSALAEK